MSWRPTDAPEDAPFFFTWTAQANAQSFELAGGEGCQVTTASGDVWLDLSAFSYNVNIGHGDARVMNAIAAQAKRLSVASPSAVYPAKIELAERLLAIAPEGFSKVFFSLGGSEATENALKMARLVTGRQKLVSRYRSYHGSTMGAVTLTGDFRRPPLEPGIPGVVHWMDTDAYAYADAPDERLGRACGDRLARLLELEGPSTVAAVMLEPITGSNGVYVPPPGYWQRVREVTAADGALLIADEVLTGFGRTGRWFGIDHEGVVPDMITVAKGLTSGYGTLGAVLVHDRVADYFTNETLFAGLTGYAHPLGCAAGNAVMQVYEEDGLIENAATLEGVLLDALRAIARRFPERAVGVRGRGLLGAIELDATPDEMRRISSEISARRVLVHLRVNEGNIIVAPPLCIDAAERRRGVGLIGEAVATVLS